MRFRLALTLDIQRAHYYTPPSAPESAPEIDSKGAFILDRSHQDEANDARSGLTEHWYRTGFQPNG
jgi:hypothetical protein